MRNVIIFALVFPVWNLVFAQTPSTPPQPDSSTSLQAVFEKELREADLAFAKATAARRLEGWMDFFADDAAILQNGRTITGKQNIREYYEPIFANKEFSLSWTPTHAEAAQDGTLGYTYGNYEARNGANISHGMYLTIWRKDNAKWKVVMDTGSQARQPQTAPAEEKK